MSLIDRDFLDQNGYVIVPEAVPPENLQAVVDAIWAFLGMDPADPDDWYREPHRHGGMVELYHHASLWHNRQYPKVHQAFAELWGTEQLWVSFDRANMKPPARPDKPEWDHKGFIHWDWDSRERPIPFRVQGVLYLTDTSEDQGGFQCVKGFHNRVEEWAKGQPEDRDPRQPDLTGLTVSPIPGRAGDLLIWHVALPHGNGRNRTGRPRLAQYISMSPAREPNEERRQARIQQFNERVPPPHPAFPGDPRGWEQAHSHPVLTPLGRKLLGQDEWD